MWSSFLDLFFFWKWPVKCCTLKWVAQIWRLDTNYYESHEFTLPMSNLVLHRRQRNYPSVTCYTQKAENQFMAKSMSHLIMGIKSCIICDYVLAYFTKKKSESPGLAPSPSLKLSPPSTVVKVYWAQWLRSTQLSPNNWAPSVLSPSLNNWGGEGEG